VPAELFQIVVKKPLADIEEEIRRKYSVRTALSDVAIEQDALVFTFDGKQDAGTVDTPVERVPVRRRRKRRVRNRMKTRGWDIVAKFINSHGQSCTIYRPFYAALSAQKLKRKEAYSTVRDILVSNGNSPKPSSIEYFLNNTLEYLTKTSQKQPPESGEP
jgi:hypothetical protein